MQEGDLLFLNILIARGGSTRILPSGPSEQVQTLIDQGLCTVSPEPESDYKTVAITAQGREALRAL